MRADFDAKEFLRTVPDCPGAYRFIDEKSVVLYVGKARALKKRLASYFRDAAQLPPKTRILVALSDSVEITTTHTEAEALLLEYNLIKEHQPKYNILLRDDKSFPYITLSTRQRFPRLGFYRGARTGPDRYFGPYASAGAVRDTLNLLQKTFRVRLCEDGFFRNRNRPCLQYQIKRCSGPCVDLIDQEDYARDVEHAVMFLDGRSEAAIKRLVQGMESASQHLEFERAARFRDQIQSLRRVQERQYVSGAKGDFDVVAVGIRESVAVAQVFFIRDGRNLGNKAYFPKQVNDATQSEVMKAFLAQFYLSKRAGRTLPPDILVNIMPEDAASLGALFSESAARQVKLSRPVRGQRARWLKMADGNAELALGSRLANRSGMRRRLDSLREALGLEEIPQRIECFDISHSHGEATVASCVVFGSEGPLKSDYRRFNIKEAAAADDYGALKEALTRRYTRIQREDGILPSILLIDGGKGQLRQAEEVAEDLQLMDVKLAAVAKGPDRKPGQESIYLAGRKQPLILPADSPGLHLIQQIRDEAHRFAITGHRTRRGKTRKTSRLEEISGVGQVLRRRLITEFGGLQGISRAGAEDLLRVKGVSEALASRIYDSFHGGA